MSLFPKVFSPLANWPWLRISPRSSLLSIVWSLLPDNDWWALPVFLRKLNPIKAHWGKGSWPFSFERWATFPPQADHVLVDLFSSVVDRGTLWMEPLHNKTLLIILSSSFTLPAAHRTASSPSTMLVPIHSLLPSTLSIIFQLLFMNSSSNGMRCLFCDLCNVRPQI